MPEATNQGSSSSLFSWAAGINQPERYGTKEDEVNNGGSKVVDGPCPDCGATFYHNAMCSLTETGIKRWCGSEIPFEEAPCDECGGPYCHSYDCKADPFNREKVHRRWSLTKPPETCPTCFKIKGHRDTCPTLAAPLCQKCNMSLGSAHTDRMCLIRQATLRARARNEPNVTPIACPHCFSYMGHHWGCPNVMNMSGKDIKVQ